MRLFIFISLAATAWSCTPSSDQESLFHNLADRKSVVIYLAKYDLDTIPEDIRMLKNAERLLILKDSVGGWTVYPPLSAFREAVDFPPFRKLPAGITSLKNLRSLSLIELDLAELPEGFDRLQHLDSLSLSLNKLTISREVDKLKKLKHLRYLELYGNKVDTADVRALKRANPDLVIASGLD